MHHIFFMLFNFNSKFHFNVFVWAVLFSLYFVNFLILLFFCYYFSLCYSLRFLFLIDLEYVKVVCHQYGILHSFCLIPDNICISCLLLLLTYIQRFFSTYIRFFILSASSFRCLPFIQIHNNHMLIMSFTFRIFCF